MKHRKGLSAKDRVARSQLHQALERADGLIHGSMIHMARSCGNANCRCTREGKKHLSWYLGVTENGKTRMKHIPKTLEDTVRRWVRQYQQVRELIDQSSQEAWKRLDEGKE